MEFLNPPTSLVLTQRFQQNMLVDEECRCLTGVTPRNYIAWNADTRRIQRAAYLTEAYEVLGYGGNFDQLLADVHQRTAGLDLDGFRIEYLDWDRQHLDNRQYIGPLANVLSETAHAQPDLANPRHQLALLITANDWALGRLVGKAARDYQMHITKPYRSSSSLPVRLARAMINLLPPGTETVLDPCCGIGTLPMEAASLGYQTSCGDQSPKMAGMTRHNLAHFGLSAEVVCRDARDWQERFDAVVTDLPYGMASHTRREKVPVVESILQHLPSLTSYALIVAQADLSRMLKDAGFDTVEVFTIKKHTRLMRHIHRARIG